MDPEIQRLLMELVTRLGGAENIPGGVASVANKMIGGAQTTEQIGARTEAAIRELQAKAQAGAQAKLAPVAEIGRIVAEAGSLPPSAVSAAHPDAARLLSQAGAMGVAGQDAKEAINAILKRNLEAQTQQSKAQILKTLGPDASQVDAADLENRIRTSIEQGRDTGGLVAGERSKAREASKRVALENSMRKQVYKMEGIPAEQVEPLVGKLVETSDAKMRQRILKEVQAGQAKAERGRKVKGTLLGAGGVAAAILAASRFLGGGKDEAQQIPPEIQMALMAQMQGQGGQDDGLRAGRDLMNLTRTLGLVKMLQEMAGLNAAQAEQRLV
jgi:hypothetical protein